MGKVISLARFKKAKNRADKAREADERRAAFGRSKLDRALSEAQARRDQSSLDGARREDRTGTGEDKDERSGG